MNQKDFTVVITHAIPKPGLERLYEECTVYYPEHAPVYSDEELMKMSVARRYQLAQQCLQLSSAHADEARALMNRLGGEYLAWYEYMLKRKHGV